MKLINQKAMNHFRRRLERNERRRIKGHFWIIVILLILAASSARAGVVADTLFHECRGETVEGQRAVASVIWNRAQKRGQTVEAVCLARKQFSCHNAGRKVAKPRTEAERAILARFEAWEKEMLAGTFKPCGPWDHYYAHKTVRPDWASRLSKIKSIGNHTFGLYKKEGK